MSGEKNSESMNRWGGLAFPEHLIYADTALSILHTLFQLSLQQSYDIDMINPIPDDKLRLRGSKSSWQVMELGVQLSHD